MSIKKAISKISIIVCFYLVTSCNNPLDKQYNEKQLDTDLKEIVQSKEADSTDVAYIAMYLMRAKLLGDNLSDKTYKEILVNAKELRIKTEKEQSEAKLLAEKAALEDEKKRQMFSKVLTVALYDKGYYKGDWEDYLTYGVAYENKSEKDIRAIKGSMLITDLFDTKIKEINLVEDDGIPAGKIVKKSYSTDYNQFMDEDTRLRSKDLKDIKAVWRPEKIIFVDGSTLE